MQAILSKGLLLALKEDLENIKSRVNSEEQFLENIIKSERFFKKNKWLIIVVIVLIVIFFAFKIISNSVNNSRIDAANVAYNELIKNPNDNSALQKLKEKDINLYALYKLRTAETDGNKTSLNELLTLEIDPLLKDIVSFEIGDKKSDILKDYNSLLNGYEFLKQNKIKEAKEEFAKIPLTSNLNKIAKNLMHYHGSKK